MEQYFFCELRFGITRSEILEGYCDWIEPKSYALHEPFLIIKGNIGFLTPKMEVFKFTLKLASSGTDVYEINWTELCEMDLSKMSLKFENQLVSIEIH